MTTFSPNLLFQEQTPGDPAVKNAWGSNLNSGVIGLIDTAIAGQLSVPTTGGTTILTSVSGASDQSRNARILLTGALTSNATILWPQGLGRRFSVYNNTTGAFTVTLGANNGSGLPAGTTQTIARGNASLFYSDGTNVLPEFASASVGTVTSVGLADTSGTPLYGITGTPVTSSGTLTIQLANQSPATVFAGPISGGAAQPTFRAFTTTDLPNAAQNSFLLGPSTGGAGSPTFRTPVSADLSAAGIMSLSTLGQNFSGGVRITTFNNGTVSTGTFTPDPGNGPGQSLSNGGAFTLAAPSFDGALQLLITNSATAGAITFSGYTVSSNTGDPLDIVSGHKFVLSILSISATATYLVKALQ